MIILHLDDGTVKQLNPLQLDDLCFLDQVKLQKIVRRVAIIDNSGRRVDLPLNKNGVYRMWIEQVDDNGLIKGERFCMKSTLLVMKATLYYSDNRVVIDLDYSGGFRCLQQGTFR